MKILLVAVNAKYIHSNLAVYSLKAYAKKYEDYIRIAEYTINHNPQDILKSIYKEQADVIAFSCYIWNIDLITQLIGELKKLQPEARIWFGGPEVSYDSRQCLMRNKELDGVMIGEGEKTFLELAQYYIEGNKKLEQIDGLAFKTSARETGDLSGQENDITETTKRQPMSLDEIPFPYEDMEKFKNKIIYYESSRGCPFSCSYCLSSIDKSVRLRSLSFVKVELKRFLDEKIPQVKFVDRTFNCNKKHAMEIWKFLKENDNGITNFHFEISADILDEEELNLISDLRPGQIQLEIGVQSTNEATIAAIHRRMDFNRLAENVTKIHGNNNIHQHLDLIAGLPYEGFDSFRKSFNEVYALKPDQLQLGFLKVLKGSMMEEEASAYGIVHQSKPPYEVLFTKYLSYPELLKIKGVCDMTEIYYNSGQFLYSIQFLEHYFDTPFHMYQDLFQFYENNGLDQAAHSRIKRYEILLDFFDEVMIRLDSQMDKEDIKAVFREILILDLYLREDLRSRPSFAAAITEHNKREEYEHYNLHKKNVHIEHFAYDIFEACNNGHPVKGELTVIFDYSDRNPLNNSAKLMIYKV